MKPTIAILSLLLCLGVHAHLAQPSSSPIALADSDEDAEYHKHEILGFSVHIAVEDVNRQPEKSEAMLWYVRAQLQRVLEVIPLDKVKLLRRVEIWVNDDGEEDDEICPGACYVPENYTSGPDFYTDRQGAVILRDMDYPTAAWCCTHATVLHELAHAYHDQFIEGGFGNRKIRNAYDDAKDSGDYDDNRVLYPWWEDQYVEHYGMTDEFEFYATLTETFFFRFPTYPPTVRDLFNHDRTAYNLIVDSWYSHDIEDDVVSFSEPTATVQMPDAPQPEVQ